MYTTKSRNSSSPRVKWEILILGLMTVVIALALVVLNFCRDSLTDAHLFVAVLAAYGWMFGLFVAMLGVTAIIEEFLPSYRKAKKFKKQQKFRKELKSALRESDRFSAQMAAARLKDFEEKFPKYRRV